MIRPSFIISMRFSFVYPISILAVLLVFFGCQKTASEEGTDALTMDPVFLNVTGEASFVGDTACFDCHEDQYQGYQEHGMSLSMFRLTKDNAVELFGSEIVTDSLTGLHYKSVAADSGYFMEEYLLDSSGKKVHRLIRSLDWVVGSGTSARTYLSEQDGWLYEVPVTWYTQQKRWDFSPGYRVANKRFDRKIGDRCMACHNSYATPVLQTNGAYLDVPEGIGCERCHGPGSIHVEQRLASQGDSEGVDVSIVNPAHLSLDTNLDVCQQCHLNTTVSLLRTGKTAYNFRPSQRLDEYVSLFSSEKSIEEGIEVVSHAERMKQSACFIETMTLENPLTCTTCHDPHSGFRSKGPDLFNVTCQNCHESAALNASFGSESSKKLHEAGANCIACHMPKTDVIEAPHSAFTDHWIRVVKDGDEKPEKAHAEVKLNPVFPVDKEKTVMSSIYEGMALITEGQRTVDTALLEKGINQIQTHLQDESAPSEAWYLHGYALLLLNRVDESIVSLEEAARQDQDSVERLNTLAQAYERVGRDPVAIERLYTRALQIQPKMADIRINLGRHYETRGRLDDAIKQYQLAIQSESWNEVAYFNLGTAFLQKGNADQAEKYLKVAINLDPFYASAMSNLGLLYLQQNRIDQAERILQTAVERVPQHVDSIDNLGSLKLNQEKLSEAIALFRKGVDIAPNNDLLWSKLALSLFRNEQYALASQAAKKALEINPANALAKQVVAATE